ncbi:hypothetical protein NO108_00621 [Planktothrix rubescens]|nr:hypothetical protein NO108_00621 [Planktothrix rubescens]
MRSYDVQAIQTLINSINPLIRELLDIADQISAELDSDGKSSTDLRRTAVQDIITVMVLLQLQYIYASDCLLHYKWWDEHGFTNLTSEQKMENASRYGDHIAFSAFHQAYSIYEVCLRQIHHSLDPVGLNQSTEGIYKVFDAVITNFGLSIDVSKSRELHIFVGLIRNTIHNLGCYRSVREPIKEVRYNGKSYRFEHLKPVLFLYPEDLYKIIYDIGIMLANIVRDPVVMALPDVRNPYRDGLAS